MNTKNNPKDGTLTAGSHISYWTDSVEQPPLNPLKTNLETDVVIVGGGIAGMSIAYCLLKAGKKVVLAEDGYPGSGETGRTTAHLVTALDDRYYTLEQLYGEKDTRLIAQSHRAAIDFVETTVRNENIDCEFERLPGYLLLHPSDNPDNIHKEFTAAANAGLEVTETRSVPGMGHYAGSSIRFARQAQFHPMKYILGLHDVIKRMQGLVFTGTHAKEITHKGITTDDGFTVSAKHVVVATNSPVNDKYAMHLKQFPYRTYAIGALVPKDSIQRALWWDTGDFNANAKIPPYHYARLQSYDDAHDLLICGGEDHATGLAAADKIAEEDRYAALDEWMRSHFTVTEKIKYRWSGQVLEPMDSLAYIGRNPWDKDNVYIVTGDSGNGMTHGTIAGILITDLICGKENEWEHLYRPSRVTLRAGDTWFREFAGGLIAYLRETPDDADAIALSGIRRGEGEIVQLRKEKYGAYRDEYDQLHLVSAACTHLGYTVKWNNDEKSWDCPCHGSRFTYEGKVINGPANTGLHSYAEAEEHVHH